MHYGKAEAGEGYSLTRTLRDRDVEDEPTGMYLWRVLVSEYPSPAPPPENEAENRHDSLPDLELGGVTMGQSLLVTLPIRKVINSLGLQLKREHY